MSTKGLKHDEKKLRWDPLPMAEVKDEVAVLTFGAQKYGPEDWKKVDGGMDRYFAALMRHLEAARAGERLDPETGLPHLAHAACNVRFLQWLDKQQ